VLFFPQELCLESFLFLQQMLPTVRAFLFLSFLPPRRRRPSHVRSPRSRGKVFLPYLFRFLRACGVSLIKVLADAKHKKRPCILPASSLYLFDVTTSGDLCCILPFLPPREGRALGIHRRHKLMLLFCCPTGKNHPRSTQCRVFLFLPPCKVISLTFCAEISFFSLFLRTRRPKRPSSFW